jgi:hypothetical protein
MRLSELIPADAPALVQAPLLATWLLVTRRTVHLWVRSGLLPPPLRLGPRTFLFSVPEVRAALDRRSNQAAGPRGVKGV